MILANRQLFFGAAAVFIMSIMLSSVARSGGSDDSAPQDPHDDGPAYFGFVKDNAGKIVSDAKVTAEIKGRGTMVTRSNAVGLYKMPGFGKEVAPNNVTISCSKAGYRQIRVTKRTQASKAPAAAIETECTLQRVSANGK